MKNYTFNALVAISITGLMACSQNNKASNTKQAEASTLKYQPMKVPTHRYGGWYCPDNLNGFPAVDIAEWKNVPVINGRLATKEETQTEASLILVDTEKYPNAKPLDITMPRLARFQSPYSKREELIIVIQALNIDNDSIVGFRYLNGGNGSARLDEITLLDENETTSLENAKFYSQTISINATPAAIKAILIKPDNVLQFQSVLEKGLPLKSDWRNTTNVNYHYPKAGKLTSSYADDLFGNYYIQNDYDTHSFTEKFLVLGNEETNVTELKIMCGPFIDDFEAQKQLLDNWAKQLKLLSEKG
jgi:hypothetical protein